MRCFLPPLKDEDKELQRAERGLKWSVFGHQIFYLDRLYNDVDYWLYETQCELDEPNRIICFYMTLKRVERDDLAHSLCSYTIKYGYDEYMYDCLYTEGVGQTVDFQHCTHDVTVFLEYQTKCWGIFKHIFWETVTTVSTDIVGVNDSRVVKGVEMCLEKHGVLISPSLVYKILFYLQRLMRVECRLSEVCDCIYRVSRCKCISREGTERWE